MVLMAEICSHIFSSLYGTYGARERKYSALLTHKLEEEKKTKYAREHAREHARENVEYLEIRHSCLLYTIIWIENQSP